MFMTKNQALNQMQELAAYIEMVLEYGDEEVLEFCAGDLESLHKKLYESVLQIKNSSDSDLSAEMRNHVSLTIIEALESLKAGEFYF